MNKRILFVDDEPKLLQGLRRMLRSKRHTWDMSFVTSGKEALEVMQGHPVDVIVSDMRMPAMDGVELLTRVKKHFPNTIRIALSGYSEQEMTLKSVGPSHQFLAKPCDPDKLIGAINRAAALRDLLENEALMGLVADIESLPSLPSLYNEVMAEISAPDGSLKRVGEIISKDVGMSVKVLQLVNSAYFGLPQHVSSPAQAVNMLGFDTIKALVLTIHVFTKYESQVSDFFPLEDLMEHSMHTAKLAKVLSQDMELPKIRMDNAYLAGLLHDVGKLILAVNMSEAYQATLASAREASEPLVFSERRTLGATHSEVGAYLIGLWGLSDDIVEAVAYHHIPGECVSQEFGPLSAVAVADSLVNESLAVTELASDAALDTAYLEGLGCAQFMDKWRKDRDRFLEATTEEGGSHG